MNIYDFIQMINDTENVVFRIFDCNSQNCLFWTDDDDDTRDEWTAEELNWHEYSYLEIGSMDMWMDKGKIYIEFNVDIEEEDDFE